MVLWRGRERLSAFVATLGYSRQAYDHFATNERVDTELACQSRALEFFDGEPKCVLFDNIKTVVLERDAYGPGRHSFNVERLQLAGDCGFAVRLWRSTGPRPRTRSSASTAICVTASGSR